MSYFDIRFTNERIALDIAAFAEKKVTLLLMTFCPLQRLHVALFHSKKWTMLTLKC